ncbi:6640_t:CDS:2 [Funneliformis caledonium]|uniref:6640_t:CDS:1 n=1 Tax=Funneliformis caledonium TaxID=1117310 RepID=A0A9N9ENW5_9GLOM|nr:6640_t:CDS:2 [Funneliformis caledonium]
MTYYLILGEIPAKKKLDFVKFNFLERVMILRNAIYDKKKNTFFSKRKRKIVKDEEDENNRNINVLTLIIPFPDKQKIRYLIKNLQSINTNDRKFTVLALSGSDKSTVVYKRKCYDYLLNFILHNELLRRYCITGNPGIGKTYFEILLLVTLLKNKMSILIDNQDYMAYITPDSNLILVNDKEYRLYAERLDT